MSVSFGSLTDLLVDAIVSSITKASVGDAIDTASLMGSKESA